MFSRQSIKLSKDFFRHSNAPASYQLAYWNRSYWIYGPRFIVQIQRHMNCEFKNIYWFYKYYWFWSLLSLQYLNWLSVFNLKLIFIDSSLYYVAFICISVCLSAHVESTMKATQLYVFHLFNTHTEKNVKKSVFKIHRRNQNSLFEGTKGMAWMIEPI